MSDLTTIKVFKGNIYLDSYDNEKYSFMMLLIRTDQFFLFFREVIAEFLLSVNC